MPTKDYAKSETMASQGPASQPPTDTVPDPGMQRAVAAFAQVLENFQASQRQESPTGFSSEAKRAVGVFANIVAALEFKFPPRTLTLEAKALSKSEIEITWTDSTNLADKYMLKRCEGADCQNLIRIGPEFGATARSFRDTYLAPNTPYRYQLVAFNSGIERLSEIVAVKTRDA